jgi:hypothetical protein
MLIINDINGIQCNKMSISGDRPGKKRKYPERFVMSLCNPTAHTFNSRDGMIVVTALIDHNLDRPMVAVAVKLFVGRLTVG